MAYKHTEDRRTNLSRHWFLKPQLRAHGHIHPSTFEANAEPTDKDHKQLFYPHFQEKLSKTTPEQQCNRNLFAQLVLNHKMMMMKRKRRKSEEISKHKHIV